MADKVSRFAPTGSMDKDSDPRYVGKGDSNGDYIDARNIQCVPQDGNENGTISPTLGNEFAFSLGSVSQQNKRYRLTFDGDPLKQHEVRFLSTQRDADMVTPNGPNGGLMFNGTQANFLSQFSAANSGSGVNFAITTPTATTVEIELTSYPMYQWYIDSVGPDVINPIVIAEAIPVNLAGPLKDIGSYDLLGDLFIFSTTQDDEPTEISAKIISVGLTTPLTSLLFDTAHGFVAGQWIRISNSNAPWLNGVFVINQLISPVEIAVPTVYAWGGAPIPFIVGQEIVYSNSLAIGEIGVAQKDENADSWTYIRLLRSVDLNFVSKWKVDCDAEKDSRRTSIYFDDDYNPYRKFYYIGDYIQDGALNYVNPLNMYQYDIMLFQLSGFTKNPRAIIDFNYQIPSGGQLPSGNIRYFTVFKDVFNNTTLPSDLSSFVITYSDDINGLAIGNIDGTITSKINVITVSEIDTAAFSEIALGFYINSGGVVSAVLNEFIPISGESMVINHTGNEPSTPFDVGLLVANRESEYKFAKNIRIIDGRVVRSNLRRDEFSDLSKWFATFKHRICVHPISESSPFQSSPVGEYQDPENGFYRMGYMYNETYRFSGRAYLKDGSITDWFWIDDIRVDPFLTNQANPNDNRRDQTGPNISTKFDLTEDVPSAPGVYSKKRVLVPYIDIFGANLSDKINNKSAYEIIDRIEIGRAEVVPEVLATGLAVMSVKIRSIDEVSGLAMTADLSVGGIKRGFPLLGGFGAWGTDSQPGVHLGIGIRDTDRVGQVETYHEYPWAYGGPFSRMLSLVISPNTPPPNYVAENRVFSYLGIVGDTNVDGWIPTVSYPTSQSSSFYQTEYIECDYTGVGDNVSCNAALFDNSMISERRICSIYSPDILMNEDVMGESLIDFGEMLLDTSQFFTRWLVTGGQTINLGNPVSRYHAENITNTYNTYQITNSKSINDGDREVLFGEVGFRKCYDGFSYTLAGGGTDRIGHPGLWKHKKSPVIYVENSGNGILDQGKNTDYGTRYVQLFTQKDGKYGSFESTRYYTTHSIFMVSGSVGEIQKGSISVFGGDTFTQQSAIKTRYADVSTRPAGTDPETWDSTGFLFSSLSDQSSLSLSAANGPGFSSALIFYSQNRVNSQMRYDTDDQFIFLKDTSDMGRWAADYRGIDRDTYSSSYTPSNLNLTQVSGNYISTLYTFDFPQRMHWSERKIYGELVDQFALFLSLNIKDLDLKYGEIMHHEIVNGELFTLQPRKWQRQLFNTRGELEVAGNSIGVLIGDGSVMSRDGQSLSMYGTSNKWSCYLGASSGGRDVIYWYNSENGVFMRFGADGTLVISDSRKMRSFSRMHTKWVSGKDVPAFNQGVRAVWDARSKEIIWTFTGWIELPEWLAIFTEVGEVVKNSNAPSDSYEDFPRFFKCKLAHIGSSLTEPGVGANWETYWEQISYDDKKYYSIFTLAFNEATNGFSTFYGHIPKTYLKWRDTFLSSHPTERNLIFEHRKGDPTTWYGVDSFLTGTIPPKIEDAYIEAVFNDLPEESKRFISNEVLSENIPDRIEYRTKSQYTWSEPADFKVNDDQFRGFILNDATVSQDPRGNTRRMDGDYIKAKFIFIGGTMNKLYSMVVKLRGRLRDFRQ